MSSGPCKSIVLSIRVAEKQILGILRSKRMIPVISVLLPGMVVCVSYGMALPACLTSLAELGEPKLVLSSLGRAELPEVNVDDLKVGPRGWIIGATEENGYMFIYDPATGDTHTWNAGQLKPTVRENDEGDITDFCSWEDKGKLIILAAQGQPAEIYRYEIEIPESGLPQICADHGRKVYENPRWARVASVTRGIGSSGTPIVLAGSTNRGELIRSDDDGRTWRQIDFLANTEGVEPAHRTLIPNRYSTISEIYFEKGTWFLMLSRFGYLEAEATIGKYKHFLNGVLYSVDGAETWKWATIEPNSLMPKELREMVERDRSSRRLPKGIYVLVGERACRLTVTSSGRLLMTTSMNNIPDSGFGGRVLFSDNGGRSWKNLYHFDKHRSVTILEFAPGSLLVGTSDKTFCPDESGFAHGDLYISADGGRTFSFCHRLVSSNKPSRYETEPFFIVGALALARSGCFVGIGTVSEGDVGQFYIAKVQHLTRRMMFNQRPNPTITDDLSGVSLATLGRYPNRLDSSDPEWIELGASRAGVLRFCPGTDGIIDYLNLTDAAIPPGTCALEFAADILIDDVDDDRTGYVFISRDRDANLIGLYVRNGYPSLLLKNATHSVRISDSKKLVGGWHRVKFSVDRHSASLHVDGRMVGSRPLPFGWSFPIGLYERRIGRGFSGLIDDIQLTPYCCYGE